MWETFCKRFYEVCYIVGVRSVRCVKTFVRWTRVLWRPVAHLFYRLADLLILKQWRKLVKEWRFLRADFARAREQMRGVRRGRLGQWMLRLLTLPILAFRRHRVMFRTVFNLCLPAAALVCLLVVVNFWRGAHFALLLEYEGKEVGYIADELVYANAAATVEGMVIDADDSFRVERAPKLTLSVARKEELLDEKAVCNAILDSVGESVTETSGLYVDGVFRGAMNRQTLQQLMQTVLDAHDDATADHVDFFPQMDVVDGLFPTSSVTSSVKMQAYLKTVPIKSIRYLTKNETVPYKTIVEETTAHPLGYQAIKKQGANGRQTVTEEIVSVNGVEKYRSVVSAQVTQAAVDQVILVGAKTYSDDVVSGDGKATGTFVWPVPYTKVVSSPFASRWGSFHGAIDIANGSTNGKPIIASDGGTVIEADYSGSYGYYVLIDHGNGFKTRYAHCSKLKVEAGQKVAQGEYIANVGNTGYSFGAHLHFEVIKNGQLVDPLKYVKR